MILLLEVLDHGCDTGHHQTTPESQTDFEKSGRPTACKDQMNQEENDPSERANRKKKKVQKVTRIVCYREITILFEIISCTTSTGRDQSFRRTDERGDVSMLDSME